MLYTFNYMVRSKNGACSTHCFFFEIPILIRFLALKKISCYQRGDINVKCQSFKHNFAKALIFLNMSIRITSIRFTRVYLDHETVIRYKNRLG